MIGPLSRRLLKASLIGAFFISVPVTPSALAGSDCAAPADSEPVRVRHVHDGDTLVLADNRRVRLIGVNTPELSSNRRAAEALSVASRDHLRRALFRHGNRAQILFGSQKMDEHGRSLAHLWLPDGENLAGGLLREGLGWAIAVPPNVGYLPCYLAAESQARDARRGVWAHAEHSVRSSRDLDLRETGFARVQGRIVRVNRGGGALWINLQGRFAIRIPEADLKWFERVPNRGWVGREIEVRGWIYTTRGESRITVHHPASIRDVSKSR